MACCAFAGLAADMEVGRSSIAAVLQMLQQKPLPLMCAARRLLEQQITAAAAAAAGGAGGRGGGGCHGGRTDSAWWRGSDAGQNVAGTPGAQRKYPEVLGIN